MAPKKSQGLCRSVGSCNAKIVIFLGAPKVLILAQLFLHHETLALWLKGCVLVIFP